MAVNKSLSITKILQAFSIRPHYWQLSQRLYLRSLKARYARTSLRQAWMWILPLSQICLFAVVFSFIIPVPISQAGGFMHYVLFLWPAVIVWGTIHESILAASKSVLEQRQILRNVHFPSEIIAVYSNMVFLTFQAIGLGLLVLLLLAWGKLWFPGLVMIPLLFVIQGVMMVGISLIVSSISVYVRDLEFFLIAFLPFVFYFSPIVYDIDLLPERVQEVMLLNPITPLIISYRAVFFYHTWPESLWLCASVGHALLCLLVGLWVFRRLKPYFVDEI